MNVSMNGLRKNLSNDVEKLKSLVIDAMKMQLHDEQELIDAMNQVILDSNILNCVFHKNDESFSDLSETRVEPIEVE